MGDIQKIASADLLAESSDFVLLTDDEVVKADIDSHSVSFEKTRRVINLAIRAELAVRADLLAGVGLNFEGH
jgi:hypothetical protein